MGEVIPQDNLRWTVLASACLHAGVALVLLMRISNSQNVVPVGIEMLYLGESRQSISQPIPLPVRIKTPSVPKAVNEPAQIKVEDAAQATLTAAPAAAGPAGARDGAVVSVLERYKFELRLFLESRKIYPETARRLRQTGTVVIQFKVKASGELSDVNIEIPSSSEILNRSALDLVRSAPRFRPLPDDVPELQLSLPIEYIL